MPLTVIGAGLGRTGTVSLKLALEQIGCGRCYHMIELIAHPEHGELWLAAGEGRPDWERLFADYGATADYPGCLFWRELADFYPSAKLVLTVRDAEGWFESTQATIFSPQNLENRPDGPVSQLMRMLMQRTPMNLHDRTAMVAEFERHKQAVIDAIPAERLLVYEVSQGWEPLCRFLGVPVPDVPFPHANARADFQAMLARTRGPDGQVSEEKRRQALIETLGRLGVRPP